MKILIVAPAYKYEMPIGPESASMYEYPLGLCYISAALKEAGHEVEGYNFNRPEKGYEESLDGIDIVMTGGLCTHFAQIERIIKSTRKANPKIKIIIGGGVVSGEPEFIYDELKPDCAVAGEGEIAIVGIVNRLAAGKKIDPIYKAAPIEDIDSLPWADYDLFDVETYLKEQYSNVTYYQSKQKNPRYLGFIASRGCPYNCTFCFHPLGRRYTPRKVSEFVREVKDRVKRYNLNLFGVVDECFAVDKKRLMELCAGLKTIGVPWTTQLRVDCVDDETMTALKDAGCYYISYGIESACNDILESMQKKITVEQINKALQITWNHKVGIQGNVLMADINDTDETVMRTLFWNMRNIRYGLNIGGLQPFPNSSLYRQYTEANLLPPKLEYYQNKCMHDIPLHKLTKMTEIGLQAAVQAIDICNTIRPQQTDFTMKRIRQIGATDLYESHFKARCIWCNADIDNTRFLSSDNTGLMRVICPDCNRIFVIKQEEA